VPRATLATTAMPRRTNTQATRAPRSSRRRLRGSAWLYDELVLAWHAAQAEALAAYRTWCAWPGRETYAGYRAAQDRADAAQEALSAEHSVTT
jgi:hypothetical protein